MRRIFAMLIKEIQQIRRDKAMLFIVLAVPVIQLIILGTAISIEVKNLPIGICDYDKSDFSRSYIDSYRSNDYLVVEKEAQSAAELKKYLDQSDIKVGIVIPKHFKRDILQGKGSSIQALIDGVDGNGANIASGYINSITMNFIQKLSGEDKIKILAPRITVLKKMITVDPEIMFNPSGNPSWYYVPGIMALLATIISTLLTAFSLVKEKELGTFEQLMVTPINRIQFIMGKILPFFILTLIEIIISLGVIWLVYGIFVKGSIWVLLTGVVFYLFSSLAMGLFISTITRTQQQALFIAWFIMIFAIMMSGFFFPVENMPYVLQNLAKINPLLYFIKILRGVIVKGSTFLEIGRQILILAILGISAITASILSFSKKSV